MRTHIEFDAICTVPPQLWWHLINILHNYCRTVILFAELSRGPRRKAKKGNLILNKAYSVDARRETENMVKICKRRNKMK